MERHAHQQQQQEAGLEQGERDLPLPDGVTWNLTKEAWEMELERQAIRTALLERWERLAERGLLLIYCDDLGLWIPTPKDAIDMKIGEAFPSNFIKAEDLQGKRVKLIIAGVEMEDIGDKEHKPVMRFDGKQKGLILNRTNATALAMPWGEETDQWLGKEVVLYPATTQYQGKTVPCVRLEVPMDDADDGEVPF